MKLSITDILQLFKIYKAYKAKTIAPIDAALQVITLLDAAGLTFSDLASVIKELEPLLKSGV